MCLTLPRGDEELAMGECPLSAGASAAPGPRHIAWGQSQRGFASELCLEHFALQR